MSFCERIIIIIIIIIIIVYVIAANVVWQGIGKRVLKGTS